jgi:hypothetical protein
VHGKAFADHRPPAAGAKGYVIFFLGAVGPEETLLQNISGIRQVISGVDALHFVLVIDMVAFHAQPGADHLVHAVGQPVGAVQG